MLSGLGEAEHLREHGLNVAADLPGVGRNLQDHLQARLVYKYTEPRTTGSNYRPVTASPHSAQATSGNLPR